MWGSAPRMCLGGGGEGRFRGGGSEGGGQQGVVQKGLFRGGARVRECTVKPECLLTRERLEWSPLGSARAHRDDRVVRIVVDVVVEDDVLRLRIVERDPQRLSR